MFLCKNKKNINIFWLKKVHCFLVNKSVLSEAMCIAVMIY